MKSTLQIISDTAVSQSLDILLIGGYALQAYGVVRQTIDVDCLVSLNDREKLDSILCNNGYKGVGKTENFHRYRNESIYLMDIDVLYVNSDTMNKLIRAAMEFHLQDKAFRVPGMIHLIALKLHGIKNNPAREARDITDITELLRLNKDKVKLEEIRDVCRRYGPDNIFAKLEGCWNGND